VPRSCSGIAACTYYIHYGVGFYEVASEDFVPARAEVSGSPLSQMWNCGGTKEHHTQLVASLHHRYQNTSGVVNSGPGFGLLGASCAKTGSSAGEEIFNTRRDIDEAINVLKQDMQQMPKTRTPEPDRTSYYT
jgi:hypothetical protein